MESINQFPENVLVSVDLIQSINMDKDISKLQYPIGQFEAPATMKEAPVEAWINTIANFPLDLKSSVENLNDEQLDTPYRPGGWTIRQLVHHVGDSHLNSYVRFKWTLTEDKPQIKSYFEGRWAELPDSKGDIVPALALVEALHKKWVNLLRQLGDEELLRSFIHPETKKEVPLWLNIGLYDWHCRHHLAHISELLGRKGW